MGNSSVDKTKTTLIRQVIILQKTRTLTYCYRADTASIHSSTSSILSEVLPSRRSNQAQVLHYCHLYFYGIYFSVLCLSHSFKAVKQFIRWWTVLFNTDTVCSIYKYWQRPNASFTYQVVHKDSLVLLFHFKLSRVEDCDFYSVLILGSMIHCMSLGVNFKSIHQGFPIWC